MNTDLKKQLNKQFGTDHSDIMTLKDHLTGSNANTCVICGGFIPEDRQVCKHCMDKWCDICPSDLYPFTVIEGEEEYK